MKQPYCSLLCGIAAAMCFTAQAEKHTVLRSESTVIEFVPNQCQKNTVLPLIQNMVDTLYPEWWCNPIMERVFSGIDNKMYYYVKYYVAGLEQPLHTITTFHDSTNTRNPNATVLRRIVSACELSFEIVNRMNVHTGRPYYCARFACDTMNTYEIVTDTLENNAWEPGCKAGEEEFAEQGSGETDNALRWLRYYPDECQTKTFLPKLRRNLTQHYPQHDISMIEEQVYAGNAGIRFYHAVFLLGGNTEPLHTVTTFFDYRTGEQPDTDTNPHEYQVTFGFCRPDFRLQRSDDYKYLFYTCNWNCDQPLFSEMQAQAWDKLCNDRDK